MFEKFTEKAINVVSSSQESAEKLGLKKVSPELILLALFDEAKGISLKIFKSYDITREKLVDEFGGFRLLSSEENGGRGLSLKPVIEVEGGCGSCGGGCHH